MNNYAKEEESKKSTEELIADTNRKLDRMNSISFTFLRGIFWGLGTAIGATIVAGIIFTVATRAINRAEEIPFLDVLIEESNLREVVPE